MGDDDHDVSYRDLLTIAHQAPRSSAVMRNLDPDFYQWGLQEPDHQIFATSVRVEVSYGPINLGLAPEEVEIQVHEAMVATGID
ncbi:hypothetical protein [Corynebacterium belfantii]|uniref:hypothetical protein n=1 Tax=Corynebacterium belfantii TaxID=2014537 RepID=UPI001A7E8F62|nr:hypothetical protein [Corynebacterium belfantii]